MIIFALFLFCQTLFQTLIRTVDREWAPNFGMLMMWASLANAIPVSAMTHSFIKHKLSFFCQITFWTLAFLNSNPDILAKVREELHRELGPAGKGNGSLLLSNVAWDLSWLI